MIDINALSIAIGIIILFLIGFNIWQGIKWVRKHLNERKR